MQVAPRFLLSICLLMSALASAYHNGAKLRRDGILNLYPFPRVGRSSPRAWQLSPSDLYLANELQYEPIDKRQLYAFPRVGRGDESLLRESIRGAQLQGMPHRRTEGPGMWFGPRLGRSFRSEDDDIRDHSEKSERSDPEQVEAEQTERDKRQTGLQALTRKNLDSL